MPPALIPLLSAAAPAAISGIGSLLSGGQSNQNANQAAALAAVQGLQTPNFNPYNFQQESVQGTLNPNMEGTVQQGPNAMAGISTNPQLMSAQMNQLAALQQLGNTG